MPCLKTNYAAFATHDAQELLHKPIIGVLILRVPHPAPVPILVVLTTHFHAIAFAPIVVIIAATPTTAVVNTLGTLPM